MISNFFIFKPDGVNHMIFKPDDVNHMIFKTKNIVRCLTNSL